MNPIYTYSGCPWITLDNSKESNYKYANECIFINGIFRTGDAYGLRDGTLHLNFNSIWESGGLNQSRAINHGAKGITKQKLNLFSIPFILLFLPFQIWYI